MASIFIPYYDAHKCDFTRPYDGIPGMLKTITAAGVRLAVASNKYQDGAEKLVHHFFGEYDFVRILGQRGVTQSYLNRLQVNLADKNADVISLSIKDVSTQRAQDILNTLIAVYNENWVRDRTR